MTEYCDHIFNFAVNLTKENDASLWIYYGLGRLNMDEEKVTEAIKAAGAQVAEAYLERLQAHGITDYKINVSDGDVVMELTKLARNAGIDVMVMGTSTKTPIAAGESVTVGPLGPIASDTLLGAPCPVLIVPPTMVPGLARG